MSLIEVEWSNKQQDYMATIDIVSNNRNGLLADITTVIAYEDTST